MQNPAKIEKAPKLVVIKQRQCTWPSFTKHYLLTKNAIYKSLKYRIIFFAVFILLLVGGGFIWLKWHVLKAKDFAADTGKRQSAIDLRPAIIAKLQQLVKDGSDGLYSLSVGKLEPDVLGSKLDVMNVQITVDSAGFRELERQQKLPDDIFNLSFQSLHVDGFGIEDLLHKKQINVHGVRVSEPTVEAWHKKQPYNAVQRHIDSQLTLYQKFTKQLERIAIDSVRLEGGTFTDHNGEGNKVTALKELSVRLDNILVDKSTEFDKSRFLFAKHAVFVTKNYSSLTTDGLYEFRIGALTVAGEQHQIEAKDVWFKPRGTKQQFESKLKTRQEMFTIGLQRIVLWDVHWWAMLHRERLIANKGLIDKGSIKIYLDRSLPKSGKMTIDNFPQQLLAKMDQPISFKEFDLRDIDMVYEEYSPQTKKSGTVSFGKLSGKARQVTNIDAEIKTNKKLTVDAKALFMDKIPITGKFVFNLDKRSAGSFTAEVRLSAMDIRTVNSFAEPLGQLSITSGQAKMANAKVTGNNNVVTGVVTADYTGLHIANLKRKEDNEGQLKKRPIESAVVNVLVKNNNPGASGRLRTSSFSLDRGDHGNFFNFVWSAVKMGLLKTIGIPPELGM